MYEDKLSNLWVGTYSGLNRLNKETDTFDLYTVDNGLPGDVVIYLLEVDSSESSQANTTELWMSSNRGLAKLYINDTKIEGIRIFDVSYGIHNTEFNRNAATQVGDKFYFGGDRGITYFSPKQIVDNPNPPTLAITSAYQINEIDKQHKEINIHKPIVIGTGTLVFGFEFTALSFSYPHHNQYSYQLQGFESNWSSASQQRQAHYPNVPPGQYLFRVRGSNADGQWNQKAIAIPVIVLPWFWETLWFQLIMLLLVILLIVIAVVYIMRNRYNKHLQKIKYQQALLNERNRISQDMHDEIGASLSEIVIYSQQQAMNGSSKPFENIAIKARGVLESIGEIIWATNPRNDKFNTLLAYMREQAVTMIEGVSIKAVLSFPEKTDNRKLTAEFRRNVYLIMKEAIINAIKHAQADKIIISVKINNNQMKLLIQDDGNGHIQQRKNGMGLKNMHKRAEALHADLSIQSLENEGCKIELVCVLP